MGQFLRGWRRKVGLATLAVACVGMFGWVQSLLSDQSVAVNLGRPTRDLFASSDSHLYWASEGHAKHRFNYEFGAADLLEAWGRVDRDADVVDPKVKVWTMFTSSQTAVLSVNSMTITVLPVPYWLILTPPTLISAWLLLSKAPPVKRVNAAD